MRSKDVGSSLTFLSAASVAHRYEVSIPTVWRWTRETDFPKPIKLGERSTRWRLSDLEAWEAQA